ncbi:hypothetical protein FACS189443_7210 [Planctomycetales bacterium]|nr:hypothetical protein FACS189443_7210 [Planctomycetales bacterium]
MITEQTVPYLMDIQTARTAAKYAEVHNIDKTEALRQFMKTKTYDLLLAPEGYLYFESMEYIYDMWDAECRGDWEYWLEI